MENGSGEILNIRNYMWNVFELSKIHEVENVRFALDLFITNMELGYGRYEGASDVDYAKLGKVWRSMKEVDRIDQKILFNRIIHKVYNQLCDAWRAKDRRRFETLCAVDVSAEAYMKAIRKQRPPVTITKSKMSKKYKKH